MKNDFLHVVRIGTIAPYGTRRASVFCKIKYLDGRLSITGVIGPLPSGNCLGSCGQIDMSLRDRPADDWNFAPGWDADKARQFFIIWKKWHLNGMQAGSPAQMAALEAAEPSRTGSDHYAWALDTLKATGLQPDASHIVNGKPYSYGSAWLAVEVPDDVTRFLFALPAADITPAWV